MGSSLIIKPIQFTTPTFSKLKLNWGEKTKEKKIDHRTSWSLLHSFHLLVPLCGVQGKFFFFIFYFVLGYSWFTNNAVTVSVNGEGTQPHIHVYPFSPKLPSQPGYHTTPTEFHVLYRSSQGKFLKTIFLFLLPNSVFSCIQFVVWPFTSFLISTLIFFISTSSHWLCLKSTLLIFYPIFIFPIPTVTI